MFVGTYFINSKRDIPFNGGGTLRELLEIPPPVTEENKAEYLQELERISEAENWIEKHSIRSIESESIDKNIPKNSTLPVLEPKSLLPRQQ